MMHILCLLTLCILLYTIIEALRQTYPETGGRLQHETYEYIPNGIDYGGNTALPDRDTGSG